ncbi:3-mercaptopyruvate sulfurtransferase-like isoform X2 [Corticium candelabrum]|uniref:3-mercaptopyruvate sulfurtransferase-like isoform X2 n=1 Tax=Corticium candelabrum TaxID=121492 RepID=UPI002E254A40|nr:3-mercaptopyruvate sulfurtransferase-like isoform X2 [Corticium candelabrum]
MIRATTSALVSTSWLSAQLKDGLKNLRILDASWHMKQTGRNAREEYLQKRIPTAGFFDIDAVADKDVDLPHMLPDTHTFAREIGKLGVLNNHHVVVYDNNEAAGIFSATRLWWTLRVFGHDQVSVLDGGLPKWQREGLLVETGPPLAVKEQLFIASFRSQLVCGFADIQKNIDNQKNQVVDARSPGRFEGTEPEPRADIPSGHIPNSINIHYQDCVDSSKKVMKTPEQLQNSITASLLAFAAYTCGQQHVAVYDGSWTEWAQRSSKRTHNSLKD